MRLPIDLLQIAPCIRLRDHLADRGDIRGGIDRREIAARPVLGLAELALERENEREVLADAHVGFRIVGGLAQRVFRLRQLLV